MWGGATTIKSILVYRSNNKCCRKVQVLEITVVNLNTKIRKPIVPHIRLGFTSERKK